MSSILYKLDMNDLDIYVANKITQKDKGTNEWESSK